MEKFFYGDVYVLEERRIRVGFVADSKPSKEEMLDILKEERFDDISDEETIEYKKVLSIDVKEEK